MSFSPQKRLKGVNEVIQMYKCSVLEKSRTVNSRGDWNRTPEALKSNLKVPRDTYEHIFKAASSLKRKLECIFLNKNSTHSSAKELKTNCFHANTCNIMWLTYDICDHTCLWHHNPWYSVKCVCVNVIITLNGFAYIFVLNSIVFQFKRVPFSKEPALYLHSHLNVHVFVTYSVEKRDVIKHEGQNEGACPQDFTLVRELQL